MTMRVPSSAALRAIAGPIPRLAPVMKRTLPFSVDNTLGGYWMMTSCEASAEKGMNVAFRPNLSVAVTV
jgi:hypothetical protein